jgi:hypothetical protein
MVAKDKKQRAKRKVYKAERKRKNIAMNTEKEVKENKIAQYLSIYRYYRRRNSKKASRIRERWQKLTCKNVQICLKKLCKKRLYSRKVINLPIVQNCEKQLGRQRCWTDLLIGARYMRTENNAIIST